MDSLLAMPPNFQPRRMDPVDIDRIGFLAVPEKEISPASSLPGFFLSSPPVFLSVFFETFYQQYLATFLSLHITIDSGLARASLLPTSRATTFTTRYLSAGTFPFVLSQCTEAVFWRSALYLLRPPLANLFFGPVLN